MHYTHPLTPLICRTLMTTNCSRKTIFKNQDQGESIKKFSNKISKFKREIILPLIFEINIRITINKHEKDEDRKENTSISA